MRGLTVISKSLILMITTLALASCGFHLRSDRTLPSNTDYLYVQATSQNAPLVRALENRMNVYQIKGGPQAAPGLEDTTITLPIFPGMTDEQQLFVVNNLRSVVI